MVGLKNGLDNWVLPEWVSEELNTISHRTYSTGFYFGKPENAQTYKDAGYIRDYALSGIVEGYENGKIIAVLKNKFSAGTKLNCLEAGQKPFTVKTDTMFDENDNIIETAPHPMQIIKIPFERPVKKGSMLRMKTE